MTIGNVRPTSWETAWVGKVVQYVMSNGAIRPAFVISIVSLQNVASLVVMVDATDVLEPGEEGILVRRTGVLMASDGTTGTWDYPPR